MVQHRRGFTLIELLVVIAIIGILAAMLFPVFARARESARKIQCLSNVKNIALAINMYLTDYDKLPPIEHRADVTQVFYDRGGGGDCTCCRATSANPYLRWPVVFDEYIKNRDVWRCPSARSTTGAAAIVPGPDWWAVTLEHYDEWGEYTTICHDTFPPGWGGSVTDSFTQQTSVFENRTEASVEGAFVQGIGTSQDYDMSMSEVADPAKHWVVGDVGVLATQWEAAGTAYPDICRLRCSTCSWGPNVDWSNCSWTQQCGAGDKALAADITWRRRQARHLGGVNAGFLDGHARWFDAEAMLNGTVDSRWWVTNKDPNQYAITGGIQLCAFPLPPQY